MAHVVFEEAAAYIVVFDFWFKATDFVREIAAPLFQIEIPVLCVNVDLVVAWCFVDECVVSGEFGGLLLLGNINSKLSQFLKRFAVVDVEFHAEVADCFFEKLKVVLRHQFMPFFDLCVKCVKCEFHFSTGSQTVACSRIWRTTALGCGGSVFGRLRERPICLFGGDILTALRSWVRGSWGGELGFEFVICHSEEAAKADGGSRCSHSYISCVCL